MVTSLLFVERHFDGVRFTAQSLKKRLSKKERARNSIAARIVEMWLKDQRNKLTILSLLSQLATYGTAIGMSIGDGALLPVTSSKFFAKPVTNLKPLGKTQ